MYANDFEFNGRYLSDYGFRICDIDEDTGLNTVSAGGPVTIQTVPHGSGRRWVTVNAVYENCLEADFTVCKDPCIYDKLEISDDEMRDIMRWLNRRTYCKMRFLDDRQNYESACCYNAFFNIEKICSEGKPIGLILHMKTDSPFGYGEKITESGVVAEADNGQLVTVVKLEDANDDIGYIYPDMSLTVLSLNDGSQEDGRITVVNDMFPGEIFEIKDADLTGVLAKQYTVEGTAMTIRETVFEYTIAAFDKNDHTLADVENITVMGNYLSRRSIYNRTNGLEDGVYRFVVSYSAADDKKYVIKKKTKDGSWDTLHDNITYSYNEFLHYGVVEMMIRFDSPLPLEIGSYIELTIDRKDRIAGDAFNYHFVKIGNTQDKRTNTVQCDCPCILELSYNPIVKLSP